MKSEHAFLDYLSLYETDEQRQTDFCWVMLSSDHRCFSLEHLADELDTSVFIEINVEASDDVNISDKWIWSLTYHRRVILSYSIRMKDH